MAELSVKDEALTAVFETVALVRRAGSLAGRLLRRLRARRQRAVHTGLIAEHTQKMAVIADAEGRIVWVNKGFENLSGYTLREARGHTPGSLLHGPGKDPSVTARLRDAIRQGKSLDVEVLNYAKDGTSYWVRLELRALHDASGVLTGFIALESDITERKLMEASLRAANERFEQVAQQSRDIIWEMDADGCLTYLSPVITSTLGYAPDTLIGRPFSVLLAPTDRDAALSRLRAVYERHERLTEHELSLCTASGEIRHCAASALPIFDMEGRFTGYRGALNDVTERRLAEQRLRESEARFKRAIRGSSDGLWDFDLVSKEVFVSERFKALLGYDEATLPDYIEFRNTALDSLVHPDDREALREASEAHLEDDAPFDLTVRMCIHGGNYRSFRIRAAAERSPDGRPQRLTGVLTDVTELKEAEAMLQWRTLHDPLTGLANRQHFHSRLEQLLQTPKRDPHRVSAVLAMDFDQFKMVNDLHGHDAGDELLCSIAARLRGSVRADDLVARFGGDEFMILLDEAASAESVRQTAARLVDICRKLHQLSRGREVTCTASVGVLVLDSNERRTPDLILQEADAAMYQAKSESRGTYRLFDPELRLQLRRRAEIEAELLTADFERDFDVVYQPIIDLQKGTPAGFEALLRWRSRGREVSPAEFIPIAEQSGMIVAIGRWVAARASRDLSAWRFRSVGAERVVVSLNVSRRELIEPDYASRLIAIVGSAGLKPADFALEITETAFVDQRVDLLPIARKLKQLGFHLAMDDFGTGQSSFNGLVDLPIDLLKIDRSFVKTMLEDETRSTVVNAVIALARHLQLEVVAEGIEGAAEAEALQAMSCRFGQGYHLGRPAHADDALSMITSGCGPAACNPVGAAPGASAG